MNSLSNRECDVKCPGDQSQMCGGKGSISLFNFKYNGKGMSNEHPFQWYNDFKKVSNTYSHIYTVGQKS